MPFSWASWLTEVGLMRVSIGPPISVMVAGAQSSPSASMCATAIITGTAGWQTPMTWVSGPRNCSISIR